MNNLVFNIHTIPDIDGARRLYDLHGLSEDYVLKAVFLKLRQQSNTEILPYHLHKIASISIILVNDEDFRLWSLGDENSDEEDIIQRFFAGIKRYNPILISWNGKGFAFPVLHYRSLLYPVVAENYWSAENNRHIDLMNVLSGVQSSSIVALNDIATLCNIPGNMGLQPDKIREIWLSGETGLIRESGELDVLKTYLLFLNWQRNKGEINFDLYSSKCLQVRQILKQSEKPQLIEFEKNWLDL